nr:restriction endonuclease subunit S [Brachyspira pilosicoli]
MVTLKDCTFNTGTYGANETASDYNKPNDIRYIRITDIDEYGRLKNDTLKTAKNINTKYILNDNDFLFARSGSVGKTLLYKKEMGKAIYAGYLIKYILNTSKIHPEYLFAYCQTNEYWKWIKKHERPAVQSNINAEEYSSLQFPLPPIDIQKQIANIMQDAYLKKEKLEKEASELLNSINDYVLNELDIKVDDSSKKEKCFTVKYSEIKNKRIDVNFYNRTIKLINKNNMVSLNKIVDIFQGVSRNLSEYSDAKLLKVKNITLDGKINLKDTEYIKNYNDNKILQTDDIITPAIGEAVKLFKFSIFNIKDNYKYLVDNNTAVIRVKNSREILPKYLLEILRNNITKSQILKLISGGGVPFIGKYLSDIEIPIPPIEIQNKIADEATNRRENAFKLQEEAKKIIEEAKKEVESILF